MAHIKISRGDAYVAGDMMIQLFIDGKKAGSLMGSKPLDLELAPGIYTVQARIAGVHKGEAVVIPVREGAGKIAVTVSGTRLGVMNHFTNLLAWLAILFVPTKAPWMLIAGVFIALICGIDLYRFWKMKPQRLRLHVAGEIPAHAEAAAAGSGEHKR